jgi:hypothetical protein
VGRLTEPDPSALRDGQRMVVTTETLPGGRVVWAFAPEANRAALGAPA